MILIHNKILMQQTTRELGWDFDIWRILYTYSLCITSRKIPGRIY